MTKTKQHPFKLGNHLWQRCDDCGNLVKLTGFGRGWHMCAGEPK